MGPSKAGRIPPLDGRTDSVRAMRKTISGMDGPGDGSICKACGDALRRGELRGAVIWKETPDHG